ncbi:MAG: CotH kinase family protein, partial [Chloroflexota bacterium]|nr:CotH kinase family protein [Chloroflexota bacterium]
MKRKLLLMVLVIVLLLTACGNTEAELTSVDDASIVLAQEAAANTTTSTQETPEITVVPISVEYDDDDLESSAGNATTATSTTTDGEKDADADDEIVRPDGWSEETHDKSADPDYDVVFPQDEVNRIDIVIEPENWQAMMDDMTSLYGAASTRASGKGGGRVRPGGGVNPVYVPVTVEFEGDTWTNVGLRFKGNSSLRSTWGSGNMKLPLRLDFDQFEDEYPEIDDQRFYGFKQLTFSSGYKDASFLREKVTADIFREA